MRLAQLLPEEAERALMLCETFIAGYYEKAEEIGDQLSLEALEVGPEEGYEFSVIAAVEQDLLATFKTLFERIRRELDRRQIEPAGGDRDRRGEALAVMRMAQRADGLGDSHDDQIVDTLSQVALRMASFIVMLLCAAGPDSIHHHRL